MKSEILSFAKIRKSETISLLTLFLITLFLFPSEVMLTNYSGKSENNGGTHHYYTCPMHPEIHEPNLGKCPRCGMELEEVN